MRKPGVPSVTDEDAGGTPAVWLFDLDRLAGQLADAERSRPRLSADEQARAAAMTDTVRRVRWRAARTSLRLALEAFCGQSFALRGFEIAEGGKPYLPAPAPAFSLSHADRYALIAIARAERGPLGVDLEAIAPRKISQDRRTQMEAFAVALAGAPLPGDGDAASAHHRRRFIQAWCRIEAYAKADGRGVGRVLSAAGIMGRGSFALRAAAGATSDEAPRTTIQDRHVVDLQLDGLAPDFAAALALPARPLASDAIRVRDGASLLQGGC